MDGIHLRLTGTTTRAPLAVLTNMGTTCTSLLLASYSCSLPLPSFPPNFSSTVSSRACKSASCLSKATVRSKCLLAKLMDTCVWVGDTSVSSILVLTWWAAPRPPHPQARQTRQIPQILQNLSSSNAIVLCLWFMVCFIFPPKPSTH